MRKVPLLRERGYGLDVDALLRARDRNTKIVFLCSPNNPTGNSIDGKSIERVLDAFDGLVVVDEAYVEFTGTGGFTPRVTEYANLVVLRTLSKAFGLAGARVGSLIAAPEIVSLLAKVIPPYSIPQPTIETVFATLGAATARHPA